MLKNIDYSVINKKAVLTSIGMVPLAIPIFLLLLAFGKNADFGDLSFSEFIVEALAFLFISLFIGALLWVPAAVMCAILEGLFIRKNTNENGVLLILFVEFIIASMILSAIFQVLFAPLILSIFITQLLRYWYLKHNNRMFNRAQSAKYDGFSQNILDQ